MKVKKNIYLVDTKLIAYYLHQRGSSISGLYNKIAQILFKFPKGEIYMAWDIGKSSHRTLISPTYKAHRAKAKAKLSQEDQDALVKFNKDYITIAELSDLLPIRNLKVNGVEADDMVSIIAKRYENNPDYCVFMLTADMDYCHSVVGTNNVSIIDVYNHGILIDHDVVVAKYKLDTRRKFSILKSIQGDLSDNIKFYHNLGPIKAVEIFNRIFTKYSNPSDDQAIAEISLYISEKEEHRIKRKLKLSLDAHEDHVAMGRTTVKDIFLANMSIADPFTDTSNMTTEQIDLFNQCQTRIPPESVDYTDFMMHSAEVLGYPIAFDFKACKVFGMEG